MFSLDKHSIERTGHRGSKAQGIPLSNTANSTILVTGSLLPLDHEKGNADVCVGQHRDTGHGLPTLCSGQQQHPGQLCCCSGPSPHCSSARVA